MNTRECVFRILDEIREILEMVDQEQCDRFIDALIEADRVFIAGAGRTRRIMEAFAIRLVHLGFGVYVVGEAVTPAIRDKDLLVIGSGSGETSTLKAIKAKAGSAECSIATLTINGDSHLAQDTDYLIVIPGAANHLEGQTQHTWQPGANSFEQSLMILLDAIVIMIANRMNIDIFKKLDLHANLE